MDIDDDFDPTTYARAPKLDVAGAVTLAVQLLTNLPKTPPAPVKKAAQILRKRTVTLQSVWKERDRIAGPEDPRPIDVMADGAMGRLHGRLRDYAGLPADRFPLAPRAQEILDTLFPKGLAFLTTDFASQWSETEKKLQRIDEEGLAKDLDQIAGPEFLAEVRRIHKLYGEAIGATRARGKAEVPSLVKPLRDVSSAITGYAIQLVAVLMDASADDAKRTAARAALVPLDTYRAAVARREARRSGEATPETEVPEVPEGLNK
jgi:hypothetical protein